MTGVLAAVGVAEASAAGLGARACSAGDNACAAAAGWVTPGLYRLLCKTASFGQAQYNLSSFPGGVKQCNMGPASAAASSTGPAVQAVNRPVQMLHLPHHAAQLQCCKLDAPVYGSAAAAASSALQGGSAVIASDTSIA